MYGSGGDASAQYAHNWELAKQEAFSLNRSQARTKEVSVPVILWDDKYYKQPKKLIDLFRRVSDFQLFNPHLLWAFDNPNQEYLFDIVDGKLRMDDYYLADNLFGDVGPVPTKDNNFFHGAKSALMGQVLSHAFQFAVKNLNTKFAQEAIAEQSRAGAKVLTQGLIEAAGDRGMNLDFARNKKIPLPKNANDLLQYMNLQEQVESTMHKLLMHTDYQHSFQDVGAAAFGHKFAVNAQFGFLDVVNGELIPKAYHPDQVRYMATKRVETFEDPNVLAASVMDYMQPTELMNHFGVGLQTGTGIQGIINYIDSVTKVGRNIGYNLDGNYWNDQGVGGWGLGSELDNLKIQGYTQKQINWMNRCFYPVIRSAGGLLMNILVQRNFVKVIHQDRFKVEKAEGESWRPATDRELKYWQETNFDRSVHLRFVPVDEEKKENLSRANVKVYNRVKLWQFDRIGHDTFINVGPYQYQPDPNGENKGYVGMPIKAQISYDKSMAKLGENDAIRVNVLYKAIDEYLINMGISEAIIVDDAQEGEPLEYLYNVKKSGIVRYDSTLMQPNNQAQQQHLRTIKLSNHTEELRVAFELVRLITTGYESRMGLSPQVQGVSERYEGLKETQLNIANQALLLTKCLREHTLFINQLLQGSADILKQLHARDGQMNVVLTDGERHLLYLTRKLALADFDIKLESGQIIENRLKLIQGILSSMAASGGAKEGGALLEASLTNSPAEAMAIYRRLNEQIEKAQKESQEMQQAIAQQNAQIQLQKIQLELEKEKEITKRTIIVQDMKNKAAADKTDADGMKDDIERTNQREQMVLDAALEAQLASSQPQQQGQPQLA
ncbi:hypothetical protein [Spirosoma fluviale]|uniref:Portal protein n=1 Tax=Spirosoma fluviale TaxID=1597977 RepID=A0A286FD42_9BACT|nr:hypothetical protein [Spirosoma fluviale]SOD80899.1 hypothetical protein SAMN06269250_1604 [Spirosoma fluviale]